METHFYIFLASWFFRFGKIFNSLSETSFLFLAFKELFLLINTNTFQYKYFLIENAWKL